MELIEDRAGDSVHFRLVGDFTFRDFQTFERCALMLRDEPIETAHLDLSDLQTLETTALGLLLILGEDARRRGVAISMTPPQGRARELLRMARVESVFPFIESAPTSSPATP